MRLLVLVCTLLTAIHGVVRAGLTLDQLLETDRAQFSSEASAFYKALRKNSDPETIQSSEAALRSRAKELLLASSIDEMTLDEARTLGYFALPALSTEERTLLEERLHEVEARLSSSSFGQLFSQLALESGLMEGVEYRERRKSLAAKWLQGQDLASLSKANLLAIARLLAEGFTPENGFTVEWTGLLIAPRSGEYRFSISPHDLNIDQVEDWEHVENSRSVTLQIDDQQVLDANPKRWEPAGASVMLTAGQRATVRLKLQCHWMNDHMRMTPAILYWEGPGLPKSVVPRSAFMLGDKSSEGLSATYTWNEKSDGGVAERQIVVAEPNIEVIWPQQLEVGLRAAPVRRIADQLVERWLHDDSDFVGDVARWPQLVSLLTTTQLKQCLEMLVDRPDQLENVSAARMERFLYGTRCGAEEAVVDVVGTWLSRRPYSEPAFAANALEYFDLNREFFYRIAEFFVFEYPDGMLQLEERYLVNSNGGCNANVASALAECYLVKGKIDEWVETLNGHLTEEAMDASLRFEWLIARSQAEELSGAYADRYHRTPEVFLAGQEWLDEAALLSESPVQQKRILREKLARHAAANWWDEAGAALEQARAEGAIPASDVDQLEKSLEETRARALANAAAQAREADNAYAEEVERRRDRSASRGESVGAARYEQILSTLGRSAPTE